jgi:hypothetical protein
LAASLGVGFLAKSCIIKAASVGAETGQTLCMRHGISNLIDEAIAAIGNNGEPYTSGAPCREVLVDEILRFALGHVPLIMMTARKIMRMKLSFKSIRKG